MAKLTLTIDEIVLCLYSGRGLSAYESYRKTTQDNPPLTEAEWSSAFAEAKNFAEDIQEVKNRLEDVDNRAIFVTKTDW